jgi:hypothetical protein
MLLQLTKQMVQPATDPAKTVSTCNTCPLGKVTHAEGAVLYAAADANQTVQPQPSGSKDMRKSACQLHNTHTSMSGPAARAGYKQSKRHKVRGTYDAADGLQ